MDITTYTLTLVGESPGLLMHSTEGMNDLNPRVQDLRALAKKTASKRTGSEIDRIAHLEAELSIYWNEDGLPHLPAANVRACIEKAARTLKDGPRVRRGLQVLGVEFTSSQFDADTPREQIVKDSHLVSPVKVGRSTVLRTRARFREWKAVVTVEALDELVDAEALERWAQIAGRLIGVGDWRPDTSGVYGRFSVDSVEVAG